MTKHRDLKLDCCKGLGILSIVMFHCALIPSMYICGTFVFNLFFFTFSGLMCKTDNINSLKNWLNYFYKICKRYAKPYIISNLLFLSCYNFFVQYHFITQDKRFDYSPHLFNFQEFVNKAITHLLMISRSELLNGASWFLKTLFWTLLLYSIIILMYNLITKTVIINKCVVYIILGTIFSIISYQLNLHNITFFVNALICIFVGDLFKKFLYEKKYNFIFSLILLTISILIKNNNLYYLCLLTGSIASLVFLLEISTLLERKQKLFHFFVYMGQNTIPILILHIISFKFVSLFYIIFYSLPMETLGQFPTIIYSGNLYVGILWKILYLFTGITVPLILSKLLIIYKNKIIKLYSISKALL